MWNNFPIPTFGFPASDNLLACDLRGDGIPKVSIGRLSISGDEVLIYLSKIIQYEQAQALSSPLIADEAWQKNVVHVISAADGSLGAILNCGWTGIRQSFRILFMVQM